MAGARERSEPTRAEIARGYRWLRSRMLLSVVWLCLAVVYLALTRGDALIYVAVALGYCVWAAVALALVRRALADRL